MKTSATRASESLQPYRVHIYDLHGYVVSFALNPELDRFTRSQYTQRVCPDACYISKLNGLHCLHYYRLRWYQEVYYSCRYSYGNEPNEQHVSGYSYSFRSLLTHRYKTDDTGKAFVARTIRVPLYSLVNREVKMNLDPAHHGKTGFLPFFRSSELDLPTKVLKLKVRVAGILKGLVEHATVETGMSTNIVTILKSLTDDAMSVGRAVGRAEMRRVVARMGHVERVECL